MFTNCYTCLVLFCLFWVVVVVVVVVVVLGGLFVCLFAFAVVVVWGKHNVTKSCGRFVSRTAQLGKIVHC